MSKSDDSDALQAGVRQMQIIVATLAGGVVFFWAFITLILRDGEPAAKPDILGLPLLTALALLFGVGSIVASILVPRVVVDGALGQIAKGVSVDQTRLTEEGERQIYPTTDVGKLLPVYQTQLIIASALNEGGAFFGALAYLVEGHAAALLTSGVLVALILSRFPTVDRVQGWLEAQLERLSTKRRDDF